MPSAEAQPLLRIITVGIKHGARAETAIQRSFRAELFIQVEITRQNNGINGCPGSFPAPGAIRTLPEAPSAGLLTIQQRNNAYSCFALAGP